MFWHFSPPGPTPGHPRNSVTGPNFKNRLGQYVFVRDPRISYEGRRTTTPVGYETLMDVCLSVPLFSNGIL